MARRPAAPRASIRATPTLAQQGKALIDSLGCRGLPRARARRGRRRSSGANKDIAPNLSQIAEKTDARWIYHWIKNPRGYSDVARMPSLRLSDDEARAVTSYLLTLGDEGAGARRPRRRGSPIRPPSPTARSWCASTAASAATTSPGMESESRIGAELSTFGGKSKEELFFGDQTDLEETWDDWTFHKLKKPRSYATERIEQVMPQFDLADEDI